MENKHYWAISNSRVLIADDKYLVGEMIQGLLEDAGYSVVGRAIDGRTGR